MFFRFPLYFHGILGSYGSVFKVKNKESKQIYACKVMRLKDEDEGKQLRM